MNIPALLDCLGISCDIHGDEATALCPAHDDHRPSWSINVTTGLHHCFGCGYGGNYRRLVQTVRRVPSYEAESWARAALGSPAASDSGPQARIADNSWKYTEAALAFFTQPPARELAKRRISAGAAQALGVLWDPEKDAWILPIRDPRTGKLWGWQEKNERCVRNRPRAVAKSRALYGLGAAEHGGRIVVVESPLDTARLYTAGVRGGVATYGVSVSDPQLSAVFDIAGSVVWALDRDAAGLRETDRLCARHPRRGILVFNYGDAEGKDPGELTDEQVTWGADNAMPALRWRMRDWYARNAPARQTANAS